MTVANPLYDTVFKFLMEDERIARTIISALLKQDVVAVEMRPHEYSNKERNSLSMFRIDFGATIRDADGKERLVLIELQKTWLETETLRFRQYVGMQYSSDQNMKDSRSSYPMVTVYLLGHRVGDIEEPVVYLTPEPRNYNGELITKGLPDAFAESVTHECIIVQIPLLRNRVNNRLEKVLSIFDQSRKDVDDGRLIRVDESAYKDDAEMDHIIHRLTIAAASPEMRRNMHVEDEYFSAIENRDTEILIRDKKLKEQAAQLEQKAAQIEQKDAQIEQQHSQLEHQKKQLSATIRMLLQAGLSPETISVQLGISVEEVERLTFD